MRPNGCKDNDNLQTAPKKSVFLNKKCFKVEKMAKTVTAKKRLGQHFLVDLTVAQNIADTVDVAPTLPILEVGPGMGVLTRMLLEKGRPLKVVEIDEETAKSIEKAIEYMQKANEMLKEATKIIGTTETSIIKVALYEYLKGVKK